MKSVALSAIAACGLILTGCSPKPQPPLAVRPGPKIMAAPGKPVRGKLPQITSRIENGFEDVILGVQKSETLASGDTAIVVAGLYGKKRVGFKILVKKAFKPLKISGDAEGMKFYQGKVHLLSIGAESDGFVSILASLYSDRYATARLRSDIPFTCIVLEGNPAKIQTQVLRCKLFYADKANDRKEDYAELFLNINLPKGEVKLAEKDTDYREAIIRALTQSS